MRNEGQSGNWRPPCLQPIVPKGHIIYVPNNFITALRCRVAYQTILTKFREWKKIVRKCSWRPVENISMFNELLYGIYTVYPQRHPHGSWFLFSCVPILCSVNITVGMGDIRLPQCQWRNIELMGRYTKINYTTIRHPNYKTIRLRNSGIPTARTQTAWIIFIVPCH